MEHPHILLLGKQTMWVIGRDLIMLDRRADKSFGHVVHRCAGTGDQGVRGWSSHRVARLQYVFSD